MIKEFWSKEEVIDIANAIKINADIIMQFENNPHYDVLYGQDTEINGGAFPFYLEKCEENKGQTSLVKFFPNKRLGLREWRKFGIINGELKSIEAEREIINYTYIESLLNEGYRWTLKPRISIPFYIEKALKGDFTSFEKAY